MLSYPVILTNTAVILVVVSVMVGLLFGSNMAMFVVLGLVVVVGYILFNFGTFSITPKEDGADIDVQPIPNPRNSDPGLFDIKEVFHIADNLYTFNESAAVCAAYGAELASYDQLVEAQSKGAEWCGYGWSATGMALFPTSQATWEALQQDPKESRRTACGHPGVNGGYFDPRLKFGVNCYGKKPPNMGTRLPQPLPGTDQAGFDAMVNKFKGMLKQIKLSPFSRDVWSLGTPDSAPIKKHHKKDPTIGAVKPTA